MVGDQIEPAVARCFSVALVGPLPPPFGGMANQTEQLARLLRESGITVDVIQVNKPHRPSWVGRILGVRALFRLLPYLWQLWNRVAQVDVIHVMANSGWAWHLFAAPAVWIGRLRGVPIIVNYRGGEARSFMETQHRWIRPTLRMANLVTVPSGFLQEVFSKWHVQTHVVPNIIDLSRFAPGVSVDSRLHFIVSRNLEDIYDIPTAIAAFGLINQRHPHARLSIAGSGPRRAHLEEQCLTLGLQGVVTFTGRLDNQKMAELYRTADILLNPTLADNMPISLLESMASGTPIVSTNVGGIPYLVENEKTALLVPVRDPHAMASAALRLVDDRALAARLRAAGLRAAAEYSWLKVAPQLFGAYALASGRAMPAPPMSA